MRVAVVSGRPRLPGSSDPTGPLADRLRELGHEVLHIAAVASPGTTFPEALGVASPETVTSFDPQALVLVILDVGGGHFPRDLIQKVVEGGGTAVYLGPEPASRITGAVQFLAQRGFYFQSL